MKLTLPYAPVAVKRQITVRQIRAIYRFELFPFRVPLRRSKLRMSIYYMLEMVYHCTVRNEVDAAFKMRIQRLFGLVSVKQTVPLPRKEFH